MHHSAEEFGHAFRRNALALFASERVLGWLELEQRANAAVSQMHPCLEVHRIRVRAQPSVEPSEEGTDV